MALTSVPLTPRKTWWTRLAKVPAVVWSTSRDVATMLTEHSVRRPSGRKLALIRFGVMTGLVLLAPLLVVFALRGRRTTAYDRLHGRVREIWETSAIDAIALLRATYQQVLGSGGFDMKAVEIPPFGRFGFSEKASVYGFLYDCEVRLGNFEEALALAAALPGRIDTTILQQADCLVALDRKAEAIALLEANLDLDGWRGKLRRRLRELGGKHLRALD